VTFRPKSAGIPEGIAQLCSFEKVAKLDRSSSKA
jgi:hypothetical protein